MAIKCNTISQFKSAGAENQRVVVAMDQYCGSRVVVACRRSHISRQLFHFKRSLTVQLVNKLKSCRCEQKIVARPLKQHIWLGLVWLKCGLMF